MTAAIHHLPDQRQRRAIEDLQDNGWLSRRDALRLVRALDGLADNHLAQWTHLIRETDMMPPEAKSWLEKHGYQEPPRRQRVRHGSCDLCRRPVYARDTVAFIGTSMYHQACWAAHVGETALEEWDD